MEILIGIVLAIVAGILPMTIYAFILWWFDRYEKEPLRLLVAAFLWGAVPAIIFSLIFQLILEIPIRDFVDPMAASLIGATVIAPITEEVFKGAVLWLWVVTDIVHRLIVRNAPQVLENKGASFLLRWLLPPFLREIDSALDGVIYGALVGFGFAAVENVLYFTVEALETGLGGVLFLAVFRAFIFGLNHALFTGFTGVGLALARTARSWFVKIIAPLAGLTLGILAHAVHNGSMSLADLCWPCLFTFVSDYGGVLILFVIIVWATVRERQWIVTYLTDEVELGTLSKEDYDVTCSYLKRVAVRATALFRRGPKRWWNLGRYHRLATELAFNKHRLSRFPKEKDVQERIVKLRQQVKELGKQLA